jgi:phage host-nuclease inhibitor protein Gam
MKGTKTSRHFRNKKKENLRAKIEELESNSKIKNPGDLCRDISYLCRDISDLCRDISYLCRDISYLCRDISDLCRNISDLCRDISDLCRDISDLCRDISYFKKGYQPRTNVVKDEKGDLVTDFTVFWLGRVTICATY